jgi:hypothetical protein
MDNALNLDITKEIPSSDFTACDLLEATDDIGVYLISYIVYGTQYYWKYLAGDTLETERISATTSADSSCFFSFSKEGHLLARQPRLRVFVDTTSSFWNFDKLFWLKTSNTPPESADFTPTQASTPTLFYLPFYDYPSRDVLIVFGAGGGYGVGGAKKLEDISAKVGTAYTLEFSIISVTTKTAVERPLSDVNFCNGDCVNAGTKDGKSFCIYDLDRGTTKFLREFQSAGGKIPSWNQEQKNALCASESYDPFSLPGICDFATEAKDNYCVKTPARMFSNKCLDYISQDAAKDKTRIKRVFSDQLDTWCSKPPTMPVDVAAALEKTCKCIIPEKELQGITANLEKTFENPVILADYVGQPLRCWYLPCSAEYQDIPLLKDYSPCTSNIVCIENIDIDASGNISNVDVKQSESCAKTFKKKSGGGGGGGGDDPGSGSGSAVKSPVLWISVGASMIIVLFIVIILISRKKR